MPAPPNHGIGGSGPSRFRPGFRIRLKPTLAAPEAKLESVVNVVADTVARLSAAEAEACNARRSQSAVGFGAENNTDDSAQPTICRSTTDSILSKIEVLPPLPGAAVVASNSCEDEALISTPTSSQMLMHPSPNAVAEPGPAAAEENPGAPRKKAGSSGRAKVVAALPFAPDSFKGNSAAGPDVQSDVQSALSWPTSPGSLSPASSLQSLATGPDTSFAAVVEDPVHDKTKRNDQVLRQRLAEAQRCPRQVTTFALWGPPTCAGGDVHRNTRPGPQTPSLQLRQPKPPALAFSQSSSPSPASSETQDEFIVARQREAPPAPNAPADLPRTPMQRSSALLDITAETPRRGRWRRGELIGRGTFGQVFLGLDEKTGKLFAAKQVPLPDATARDARSLVTEISLMKDLDHPHIVRYLGADIEGSDSLYIFLEYVPGGSIARLVAQFGVFQEPLIRRYTHQILQGAAYLHERGIVHRDIKGANVLVTDHGLCKLADFGCSRQLEHMCTSLEDSMRVVAGSVPWMAPEVVKQSSYGCASDVWSIGATVIEMATAHHPWPAVSSNLAAIFAIATTTAPPMVPATLSGPCQVFLRQCLVIDPRCRASASELLQGPFICNALSATESRSAGHWGVSL